MRVMSFAGVAVAVLAVSACGRSSSDVSRLPSGDEILTARQGTVGLPRKTPGQARLSALDLRQAPPTGSDEKAPMATYSRYDGRAPGDAAIPRGVEQSNPRLATLLPRPDVDDAREGNGPSGSKRDIVDLGLSSRGTESSPVSKVPDTRLALSKAPAPVPRPVPQTPKPSVRPAAQTTSPLPPQPSIASLKSPVLSVPFGTQDQTPTGLPQFGTEPAEQNGIPLGTIPASLGLANIRAAEMAVPSADELEQSSADDSGAIGWNEAAALIRAGEVETFADIGEFEVLLTLCSGRGVISIQPTPGAISEVTPPKVICGKTASLTPQ